MEFIKPPTKEFYGTEPLFKDDSGNYFSLQPLTTLTMKTIFEKSTRDELIDRINTLNDNSNPLWGKMNIHQMTKHCTIWCEWVLGKNDPVYKQEFLGRIFGKLALKSNTKDNKPISKNMPAGKGFTIKEKEGDLQIQKTIWTNLIADFEQFSNDKFIHDFFGKMTKEQIGIFVYKHNDHHLRQFGVQEKQRSASVSADE